MVEDRTDGKVFFSKLARISKVYKIQLVIIFYCMCRLFNYTEVTIIPIQFDSFGLKNPIRYVILFITNTSLQIQRSTKLILRLSQSTKIRRNGRFFQN